MVNFKDLKNPEELGVKMELADFQKMESIRQRAVNIVQDSTTAESLKPYYRQFCKRPCFHDDYLASFNRSNVDLIDTDGKGIDRITETGIVANGTSYEVDCIIFATGFEVGTAYTRRSGYDVQGRNGIRLSDKWAGGIRTLHGMHSHGFPNLFVIQQSQAAFTVNFPHAMDEQARHLSYIASHCLNGNVNTVEASESAEEEWVQEIIGLSRFSESFQASCTPGYYNNEGKPNPVSIQNNAYGAGSVAFFKKMQAWRDEGQFEGLMMG
jgi:cyclohexanone monooxygenase